MYIVSPFFLYSGARTYAYPASYVRSVPVFLPLSSITSKLGIIGEYNKNGENTNSLVNGAHSGDRVPLPIKGTISVIGDM